jgi:hypothetical protein
LRLNLDAASHAFQHDRPVPGPIGSPVRQNSKSGPPACLRESSFERIALVRQDVALGVECVGLALEFFRLRAQPGKLLTHKHLAPLPAI